MDLTIAAILSQDGITNGAIYALLSLALVLVFLVTRAIFIPQGEFVAFGALTLVSLQSGHAPGTLWLLSGMALLASALDIFHALRTKRARQLPKRLALQLVLPLAIALLLWWAAPRQWPLAVQALLTLALITPMGPLIYRLAYQPLAGATTLVLLIVSVGVHFVMTGLGLYFFGPEGSRTPPFWDARLSLGTLQMSGQSIVVIAVSLALILLLALFFNRTLYGKALRATAVNRTGARLMGISTTLAGNLSFMLAAFIGALSGILIAPITTIYYDSGFLIGLKGFVAAIIGGLASYPVAAAGALFVGLLEAFSSFWFSSYKEVIVFTLVLPVLLWRSLAQPHSGEDE